tara:strand:- start:87 stop:650 length:564 start_codon:yes stop_codon:yes gene_type:complete
MNLTNIRKLISKLNKEDKIVRVWSKKKPELLEDLKKVQYQLDEEKQQLTPTVQMKRKRIIKLNDSKTDLKKMPQIKKKKKPVQSEYVKNLNANSVNARDKIIKNMELMVKLYNPSEIKKQKDKESIKKYTEDYFKLSEQIKEKGLDTLEDPDEFFKTYKEISKKYVDVNKNFVRRIKAQLKSIKKKA